MTLQPIPLNFLIYEENFILFFISAGSTVSDAGIEPRTVRTALAVRRSNQGVYEISYIFFVCFFKFRILIESGNNFAKIIGISLLQGCVSIPYRYINSASLKLLLFSQIPVSMQCRLALKTWRLTLGPWRLPLEPCKLTWILECSPWSLSCSPWGHMEAHHDSIFQWGANQGVRIRCQLSDIPLFYSYYSSR